MEKHHKLLDDKVQDLARSNDALTTSIESMEGQIEGFEDQLKEMGAGVEELKGEMQCNFRLMLKTTEGDEQQDHNLEVDLRNGEALRAELAELPKNFKVKFPRFDGTDLHSWIRKCKKFFNFNPMSS